MARPAMERWPLSRAARELRRLVRRAVRPAAAPASAVAGRLACPGAFARRWILHRFAWPVPPLARFALVPAPRLFVEPCPRILVGAARTPVPIAPFARRL